jgi:hypothetical protein
MVRLHGDLLDPLDDWIAKQPNPPSRPEAIRIALRGWLTCLRLIPVNKPSRNKQQ